MTQADLEGKTVIIVDDSKFVITQLSEFFEEELSMQVIATGNDGNEAINLYKKYKPDLITLDITMPNTSGEEALINILEFDPNAIVMMISAVKGDSMLTCLSNGAKSFIEKPLKLDDDDFIASLIENIITAIEEV